MEEKIINFYRQALFGRRFSVKMQKPNNENIEDIIKVISSQFKEELTKENLQRKINNIVMMRHPGVFFHKWNEYVYSH